MGDNDFGRRVLELSEIIKGAHAWFECEEGTDLPAVKPGDKLRLYVPTCMLEYFYGRTLLLMEDVEILSTGQANEAPQPLQLAG